MGVPRTAKVLVFGFTLLFGVIVAGLLAEVEEWKMITLAFITMRII